MIAFSFLINAAVLK